jgi:hypothetical protein
MVLPPRQRIDPLDWQTPIVNSEGKPTQQFIQLWQRLFGNESNLTINKADKSTLISTTAPLDGGGDLSENRTLVLLPSGVTPDTYGDATNVPQITVDEFGRILTAVDVPITGGGGGGAWEVAATWTYSVPVPEVDFTGLGGYTDLLIIIDGVELSVTGVRCVRVSTDNGASFFTGAVYPNVLTGGTLSAGTAILSHGTNATAARTGIVRLNAINTTSSPKVAESIVRAANFIPTLFTGSADPIDAIRVFGNAGGNLTGGSILVLGR